MTETVIMPGQHRLPPCHTPMMPGARNQCGDTENSLRQASQGLCGTPQQG